MVNPGVQWPEKQEILRLLFEDNTRDEVAAVTRSGGTVSNVEKEFVHYAEVHGLKDAADAYGVGEEVENLLRISKQLKDSNLTVPAVKTGVEFYILVDQNGVQRTDVPHLIGTCTVAMKHERPERFFDAATELAEAERKNKMTFTEAVTNFKANVARIQKEEEEKERKFLAFQEKQRSETKRLAEEERKQTQQVTNAEQGKFKKLVEQKRKLEASIAAAERSLSELRQETKTTEATHAKKMKDLGAKIDEENRQLDGVRTEMKDALERADRVEKMVKTFEEHGIRRPEDQVSLLVEIEKLGGDPEKIVALVNEYKGVQVAIGTANKSLLAAEVEVNRIRDELGARKKELGETDSRLSTIQVELDGKQRDLQTLKDRLRFVRSRIASFESTGDTLKDMRTIISSRKTQIRRLDEEVTKRKADLKAVVGEIAEANGVESSIDGIKKASKEQQERLAKAESDGAAKEASIKLRVRRTRAKENRELKSFLQDQSNLKESAEVETGAARTELNAVKQALAETQERLDRTMNVMRQIDEKLNQPGYLRFFANWVNNRAEPIEDKHLVAAGISLLDFLAERVKASAIKDSWKMTRFFPGIADARKALQDMSDALLRS